eukprot:Phypoly_transcript_02266.p1 GENE.Phypoly_transcript_02266~~Phypoly_transcript_02266.p1  ORF type:complete len:656 (+),score=60.61 Phypoly_transcript_02266:383-2350(+)
MATPPTQTTTTTPVTIAWLEAALAGREKWQARAGDILAAFQDPAIEIESVADIERSSDGTWARILVDGQPLPAAVVDQLRDKAKGWERDLLRKCVEPNPGPVVTLSDLISEANRRLSDDEEREHYAGALRNFVIAVKKHSGKAFGTTVDHARAFLQGDDPPLREALGDSYDFLVPLLQDTANIAPLQYPPGGQGDSVQIDLLTVSPLKPQALRTIMLSGFEGCKLRGDRANSPQHLLAANTALFPTIGRQEALKMTFAVMQKRVNNRSAHTAYNPLVATHAPPGGGKSTFLDLVLSRSDEVLQQSPPHIAEILKNSVPLAVTYNSKTPYNSSIKADNIPEFSLGCRMLYSYYYTYDSDFNSFLAGMQHYARVLTLDGVVQCIRLDAGNKSVLLGLDEVVSAFGKDVDIQKVTQIVSKVGLCLNQFGSNFNAVVTTLDTVVVNAETTLSGRTIAFIPLPRLTVEQSVELFQQELANPSTPSYFRSAIVACGGHARTLESLKTFYTATKATCGALEYPQFLLLFCQDLLNVNVLRLTLPLVLCALRNKPVELEFRPTSSTYTIRQYIRDGYYINNLTGSENCVIPIVSPLGLLHFARQAEFTSAVVEQKLAACLISIIQINQTHWQEYIILFGCTTTFLNFFSVMRNFTQTGRLSHA